MTKVESTSTRTLSSWYYDILAKIRRPPGSPEARPKQPLGQLRKIAQMKTSDILPSDHGDRLFSFVLRHEDAELGTRQTGRKQVGADDLLVAQSQFDDSPLSLLLLQLH